MPSDHRASEAIVQLTARGVIGGYEDESGRVAIAPDEFTRRAQMAALIAHAMGWDDEAGDNPFTDRCEPPGSADCIVSDLWRNVGTTARHGVALGYDPVTFGPSSDVLWHRQPLG